MRMLEIQRVTPWSEFNEYEGQIEGIIAGQEVCCYVMLPSGEWGGYRSGDVVPVALWLERSGAVQVLPEAGVVGWEHMGGPMYRLRGRVVRVREGGWLEVESALLLDVDLDWGPFRREELPLVRPGDWVSVEGRLQADLDPDPA